MAGWEIAELAMEVYSWEDPQTKCRILWQGMSTMGILDQQEGIKTVIMGIIYICIYIYMIMNGM